MKFKNWIIKQSLFWNRHIKLLRSILVVMCLLPLVDIGNIIEGYMWIFKETFKIMKMLFIPIAAVTFVAAIICAVIYIKNEEL